jgi:riboflavin kinase
LEQQGLVEREISSAGQLIRISPAGMKRLSKEFADYKKIFHVKERIDLEGTVVSGLGEGQYYISVDGYMNQFQKKLGFKPFPGTLNVKIKEYCFDLRKQMELLPYIRIDGFSNDKRTYGASDCYPAQINGIRGYIIVPERTHYKTDLLEIIAPVKVREALNLKDGDEVKVTVGDVC